MQKKINFCRQGIYYTFLLSLMLYLVGCGTSKPNRAPVVNLKSRANASYATNKSTHKTSHLSSQKVSPSSSQKVVMISPVRVVSKGTSQTSQAPTKNSTTVKSSQRMNLAAKKIPNPTPYPNPHPNQKPKSKLNSKANPKVSQSHTPMKPHIPLKQVHWTWPHKGPILRNFQACNAKGIDIGGTTGSAVKAGARGTVVYSGSGLKGYGNLIIIKHDEDFLSAYAHNDKLMVKEGERVVLGQEIAKIGKTDTDRVKLHFEIRYKGKPVDPIRFLPRS